MKQWVITQQNMMKEIRWFGICLLGVLVLHIYAILTQPGKWSELISELPFFLTVTLVFYILSALIRLIIHFVKKGMGH